MEDGMAYQYILFDLDGTLTDSGEGITKSAQYALHSMGIEEHDLHKLEKLVGPPLRVSFRELYGFDEGQTTEAILKFRERYNTTGVFENEIYAGIKELLCECREKGIKLAIASSKPQYLVEKVLKRFEIGQYFDVIVGCIDEGKRDTKLEVVEEALRRLFPDKSHKGDAEDTRDMTKWDFGEARIIMVGDRKFDIEGAKHFGLDSLGVTYGYAPCGELEKAGADYLADSIAGMRGILLGRWQKRETAEENFLSDFLKKVLGVLAPLALYWLVTNAVVLAAQVTVGLVSAGGGANMTAWLEQYSAQLSVGIGAAAVVVTYPFMYRLFKRECIPEISPIVRRNNTKRIRRFGAGIFLWAGVTALGLNLAMNYLHIFQSSDAYTKVSDIQYSVSLPVGIVVYGILTPVGEELVFRGVLYNRLKKYTSPFAAIIVSALIFGLYHGNLVQLVYAAVMGMCMAVLYESYERLAAPLLFHCGANCFVYVITKWETAASAVSGIPVMMLSLIMAAVGILWTLKKQCLAMYRGKWVHIISHKC